MPRVDVAVTIEAPLGVVWQAVNDIAAYPDFMENVLSVTLEPEVRLGERVSHWSTVLKGSVLEWTEHEVIDDSAYMITFAQIDGDLDEFRGFWKLENLPSGAIRATLSVNFEIGIPLLAEMLNPVAERALRDNSLQMLTEIEHRAILDET